MRPTLWNAATLLLFLNSTLWAQDRSLLNTQLPTGAIGQTQVARRPGLAGYQQPVLIRIPDGATLSMAEGGGFTTSQANVQLVSLQVGSTYRLRVSNIPNSFGYVYPTVELIDRLHAPPGKETRYPVPVEITAEELQLALSGKFVTRVIYVEDPRNAVGGRELPEQRYFEALPDEDPYEVASRIGRPIAILRMGSVAPNPKYMNEFLFGSPPFLRHNLWPKLPAYKPSELEPQDLPADPEKRSPLPNAPDHPETREALPKVPSNPPEKKEIEEQPKAPVTGEVDPGEPDPFEELDPVEELDPEKPLEPADAADDNLFEDPGTDNATEEDPFAEFE